MLTAERNQMMTRVGPDTPGGALLRRYWQPVALADELEGRRPAKAVKLLGQDFVLFRDSTGRYGLLDRDCPHRGADLAFGRLEDGGLRCLFQVKQRAYPVVARSGVLFAYLGEGRPPAMPAFDCFVAPDAYTFAFKGLMECNWLQALEVGIDPAHSSYLHRFANDEPAGDSYGRQFRSSSADSDMPVTRVMRESFRPEIKVEGMEYGLRLVTLRNIDDRSTHVRVTNLIFPQAFVIPMSSEMTISQWHVPIDDVTCYWYAIFTSFGAPVDKRLMRDQRLALYELPDYRPRRNRANNYGYDSEEQARQTFTGMGFDVNVHDNWAVESQGRIQDRTREHLASTDKAIAMYRRMLLEAIERNGAGDSLMMVLDQDRAAMMTGPASVDGIGPADRWEEYWKQTELKRRESSNWASTTTRT
jgi:phthalate 4,5-dioxygenase